MEQSYYTTVWGLFAEVWNGTFASFVLDAAIAGICAVENWGKRLPLTCEAAFRMGIILQVAERIESLIDQ